MLKVNIGKQLDAEKAKTQQGEHLIKEANLLLESNHQRERDLLKKIGLGHSIIKAETARGLGIERDALEQKFEGKVYMLNEIRNLCLDYDLRFLRTKHFKGHIDNQIGYKVKDFFDKHKLNENYDNEMFYILAPEKAFNLEDRPKPEPVDPLLFYKPNRQEEKYLLVHQWGNDFTVFRLLKGFITRNVLSHFISMFIIGFCLSNIVFALFTDFAPFGNFIGAFVAGLAIAVSSGFYKGGEDWENKYFNTEKWNTTLRD